MLRETVLYAGARVFKNLPTCLLSSPECLRVAMPGRVERGRPAEGHVCLSRKYMFESWLKRYHRVPDMARS